MERDDHRFIGFQGFLDRLDERLALHLHLSYLIDYDYVALIYGILDGLDADRLEFREVDTYLTNHDLAFNLSACENILFSRKQIPDGEPCLLPTILYRFINHAPDEELLFFEHLDDTE